MTTDYQQPYGPGEQASSSSLSLTVGFLSFGAMLPLALLVAAALL